MARGLGLQGILARTDPTLEENGEPVDSLAGETNGQSRGGLRATRSRSKRPRFKPGEKPRGCKLTIPDTVFDRLRQTAIKRGKTMSVLAGEILNRELPYFEVKELDRPPAAE